jgi:alpha-amylase
VEINLAAMAGHAPDRFYSDPAGIKLGMLDERIDLPHTHGLTATDDWLDLTVGLTWSQAASLWCFPIQTVSQSDGGIEGVYQSSAIVPHWHVTADEQGRWEVRLKWSFESLAQVKPAEKRSVPIVAPALI